MIKFITLDYNNLWNKVENIKLENNLILRSQIQNITNRFNSDNIELIIGPRQSGKTTMLFLLIKKLMDKKIHFKNIYYINIDTIFDYSLFENPLLFIKQIEDKGDIKKKKYIFIDEIQRLKNPGLFIKGVYDLNKNIKFFVTGSASLEIKARTKEFLTGRKKETILLPLSFNEIIKFEDKIPLNKTPRKISKKSLSDWSLNEKIYGKYLKEKMDYISLFGCYPQIYKSLNKKEKILDGLAELYNSYVKKDIVSYMNVEQVEIFNNLVKVLSTQIGNLVNKSEICSLIRSNAITITKYLSILKETFITYYLPPYTSNRRNEVKSVHKCFFIDNGLRNFALKDFNNTENRNDKGQLYENIVFTELYKNLNIENDLFYWRTKAGAEVDFVFKSDNELIPVEIKSGTSRIGTLSKSYHSFIEHFKPKKGIYLNKDIFAIKQIKDTTIYYMPIHWFLLFGIDMVK